MASSTSTEQQQPCRLLELPPELRLMMWETYFTTDVIKEVAQPPHPRTKVVSLLSTCREIFCEAAPVYTLGLRKEYRKMIWAHTTTFAILLAELSVVNRNGHTSNDKSVQQMFARQVLYKDQWATLLELAHLLIEELVMLDRFVPPEDEANMDGKNAEADGEESEEQIQT